jgi:hypothetical protein
MGKEFEGVRQMKHYNQLYFPNIVKRFETFIPWLLSKKYFTISFEEFKLKPKDTFKNLFARLLDDKNITSNELASVKQITNPENSKTYLISLVSEWPHFFKDKYRKAFEKVSSQMLLARLNYK